MPFTGCAPSASSARTTNASPPRRRHKLADLQSQSLITDPQLLERKRAVIEAAIARAKAARES